MGIFTLNNGLKRLFDSWGDRADLIFVNDAVVGTLCATIFGNKDACGESGTQN